MAKRKREDASTEQKIVGYEMWHFPHSLVIGRGKTERETKDAARVWLQNSLTNDQRTEVYAAAIERELRDPHYTMLRPVFG